MGISTTWTCDKCHKGQQTSDGMSKVEIRHTAADDCSRWRTSLPTLLCQTCLIEMGVHPYERQGMKLPDPLPTTVELLVNLLENLGVKFEE